MEARWTVTEQDRSIAETVARERGRLRGFIRRRVPDPADAEEILQEVFYELVEATRLPQPLEQVGAWLFQVARRRVIDVSGDGDNNTGRDITAARDEAVTKGVTINGLVILSQTQTSSNHAHTNPLGGLADYYRDNVIGGPGAFVMVADNFNSFGNALVKKLIAEIVQVLPQQ